MSGKGIFYEAGATRRWELLEEWLHGRVEMQGFLRSSIDKVAAGMPKKARLPGTNKWVKTHPIDAAEELVLKQYILKNLGRYLDDADTSFLKDQISQLQRYGTAFGY